MFPRFARLASQKNKPSWKLYLKAPPKLEKENLTSQIAQFLGSMFLFFDTKSLNLKRMVFFRGQKLKDVTDYVTSWSVIGKSSS